MTNLQSRLSPSTSGILTAWRSSWTSISWKKMRRQPHKKLFHKQKNLSLKSCCFQQCFNPLLSQCPNDESTKSVLLSMTTLRLKHILVMVLVWCNLQSAKLVHWFLYPFNLEAFNITILIQRLIIQFSCFCQILRKPKTSKKKKKKKKRNALATSSNKDLEAGGSTKKIIFFSRIKKTVEFV